MTIFYGNMVKVLRQAMANNSLAFDAETTTSELWGESYEGCVPGYGGAYAHYLGLKQAPNMRFEMTVYDSRFLYVSQFFITLRPIPSN